MNLEDLYKQTPVARHEDITVSGDRVFVRDQDGSTDEYLVRILPDGEELRLVRSDREIRDDLRTVKDRLGAG